MTIDKLKAVLDMHTRWLQDKSGGECADLSFADLSRSNLSRADLSFANLSFADLSLADLSHADLSGADLSFADLHGADLSDADLSGADLSLADLSKRDIDNIKRYRPFAVCPESGQFIAWKKGADNHIIKLSIPSSAKRTSSLVGRKCRCDLAMVLAIFGVDGNKAKSCGGWRSSEFIYTVGEYVEADSYDGDIRVECSHGIHFFITRAEAEAF